MLFHNVRYYSYKVTVISSDWGLNLFTIMHFFKNWKPPQSGNQFLRICFSSWLTWQHIFHVRHLMDWNKIKHLENTEIKQGHFVFFTVYVHSLIQKTLHGVLDSLASIVVAGLQDKHSITKAIKTHSCKHTICAIFAGQLRKYQSNTKTYHNKQTNKQTKNKQKQNKKQNQKQKQKTKTKAKNRNKSKTKQKQTQTQKQKQKQKNKKSKIKMK